MGNHARQLHNAAQLYFAPTSAGRRRAQRAGKVCRFALEAALRAHHAFHLLTHRGVGGGAIPLQLADAGIDAVERTLERLHDLPEQGLPLLPIAGRGILQARDGFAGGGA